MNLSTDYEVIIIGGSYAGMSAGLTLARSMRQMLMIDSGKPCNRFTPHSHGFLTRDGEAPGAISALARQQLLAYPTVTFRTDTAVNLEKLDIGYRVETESGQRFSTKKILLATGVTDVMPSIAGFADCWGKSVLHCPYCHGYEVRGQRICLIANGDTGFDLAQLIFHWSSRLMLFTNGAATLTAEQRQRIQQRGIPIMEAPIRQLEHQEGYVRQIHLVDDTSYPLDALFARPSLRQHSSLAEQIGCELTETGLVKGDEFGKTSVPGVFVAGDNSTLFRQVVIASANGTKAGAWLNRELIEEN